MRTPTFDLLADTDVYASLVDGSGVSFVLARPGAFFPDYEVEVPDTLARSLGLADPSEADVWVLVTGVRADFFTANLRGPLVVNRVTGRAAQVVLDDSNPTSAPLGV